jgi:hypothetical protein
MFAAIALALTLASAPGAAPDCPGQRLPAPANPGVDLNIAQADGGIAARITARRPGFIGVILVSRTEDQAQDLVDLPPLLVNSSVLIGGSTTTRELEMFLPLTAMPAMRWFAEAIVYDGNSFASSIVMMVEPGVASVGGD